MSDLFNNIADDYGEVDSESKKSPVEQLQDILDENAFLRNEVRLLNQAIILLRTQLKEYSCTEYDHVPINKSPYEMTKEELLKANEIATARIQPKATSTEKIPMATFEQQQVLAQEASKASFEMLSIINLLVGKVETPKE
jgi:hypothetical protein